MASLPTPRTRRYRIVKFIYTADNNDTFIRTQRVDKDINGNPFIDLPSCFQQVSINAKEKIWGESKNLRKSIITYEEPNNQSNQSQITIYVPEKPVNGTSQCLREIIQIVKDKFQFLDIGNCVDYYGENRFTTKQPNSIES